MRNGAYDHYITQAIEEARIPNLNKKPASRQHYSYMNFTSQFSSITTAINSYADFWRTEVIEQYPKCFSVFPEEWIDSLMRLSDEELFAFERQREIQHISSESLREYCRELRQLSDIPRAPRTHSCSLGHQSLLYINGKKRHEIEQILGLVDRISTHSAIDALIDFGGGIGNLARIFAKQYRIPATSIDYNAALQQTGKKRYAQYCPEHAAPLQFHHADILALTKLPDEVMLRGRDTATSSSERCLSVGLHTCGPLANSQLRLSIEAGLPIILNFGCCFNKLSEEQYYLSSYAKTKGIRIGPTARVLASHTPRREEKAHAEWKRVKTFRYMIHLYLYHILDMKEFYPLGSSHPGLYQGPFETYALEQLRRLDIPSSAHTRQQLVRFWNDETYLKICRQMIMANSIRSFIGRPIEALFALDRAMFLQEQGYQAEVQQVFDPDISPRNLGVLGIK